MSHTIKTDNVTWVSNSDASGEINVFKNGEGFDKSVQLRLEDIIPYLKYCGYQVRIQTYDCGHGTEDCVDCGSRTRCLHDSEEEAKGHAEEILTNEYKFLNGLCPHCTDRTKRRDCHQLGHMLPRIQNLGFRTKYKEEKDVIQEESKDKQKN